MAKPSIKTLTVRSLVNFLLVLAVILLVITGYNFRTLSESAIRDQALASAELVRAGLTAHMKAGIMDKRDYYLEEIRQLQKIDQLRIVRSIEVDHQYGPGGDMEKSMDDVAQQAFESLEPVFVLDEWSMRPSMRVIIPYIASAEGSLNCLSCHEVKAGTVLGAVDMEMDVSEYRNHSLAVLAGISLVSLLFLVLILVNTSRTIQNYVKAPLETLIDNTMDAYKSQTPLQAENFPTEEFTHVASEINLFNNEVIAHQDMLREKNLELLALNDEIESTLRETVFTMGVIEEQRSREARNHTRRVSLYSRVLAENHGLPERDVELVAVAAPLHDIGKLGIADNILFKEGALSGEEREIMMGHTQIGYSMLKHSERDILQAAGIIARQHHEKWDGSGYPQGLKGQDIHIYGRIVALADVFDALYSERVYKESWDLERVVDWIVGQRGQHFEPALVDTFLRSVDRFVEIAAQYPSNGEHRAGRGS